MCWIFHKWTKWEDVLLERSHPILALFGGDVQAHIVQGQKRHCLWCGLEELRAP